LLIVIGVVAVVALALSAWALLRPSAAAPSDTATTDFSDAQRADAKTKICTAFETVRTGVSLNTNLQVPGGQSDVAGSLAVAANARLALFGGGQYLRDSLDPATSPELADSIRRFADLLSDIGANSIAGALNTDPPQSARLKEADGANRTIEGLCA
jgi:ABC-type glycerol-3-phosphate transport system substrate-binding protein